MLDNLRARLFASQAVDGPELVAEHGAGAGSTEGVNAAASSLSAEDIRSSASGLYSALDSGQKNSFIDPRIYTAMVAAERVLERAGDIYDAIVAMPDYYRAGLVIMHEDPGVQKAYREWAERGNLDYWLADSHLTSGIYGQSYPAFYGSGEESLPFCISPKNVAVGSAVVASYRPAIYLGSNSNGLYQSLVANNLGVVDGNEWPIPLPSKNASSVLALNPKRVYQRTEPKPSFKRYALPPVIRAWDEITQRLVLGEMIKDTVSALKTQARLWTIDNPLQGEIPKLAATLRSMKEKRVYDLVWRGGVRVTSVIPGTVSELLADKTWMSMTDRCFRAIGLPLVLSTGEPLSGNATTSSNDSSATQVLTAITRLDADMYENVRIARWMFSMYRSTSNDRGLMNAELPEVYYRETMLTLNNKVRAIVPLLNYGAMSIRTTLERVGVDPDIELARLRDELPLRGNVIQPYAGFGQVANGKETQSSSSPGRPIGPDANPEHAETNRQSAQEKRNGR